MNSIRRLFSISLGSSFFALVLSVGVTLMTTGCSKDPNARLVAQPPVITEVTDQAFTVTEAPQTFVDPMEMFHLNVRDEGGRSHPAFSKKRLEVGQKVNLTNIHYSTPDAWSSAPIRIVKPIKTLEPKETKESR